MKNKKNSIIINVIIILLAVASIIMLIITKTPNINPQITIEFETGTTEKIDKIMIKKGESITLPEISREGYIFGGWYQGHIKVTNKTIFNDGTCNRITRRRRSLY